MSVGEAIRQNGASASKGVRPELLLTLIFVLQLALMAARYFGAPLSVEPRGPADFDDFHLVGQAVWRGDIMQAYDPVWMAKAQKAAWDKDIHLPWTYPPIFDLVVAVLALVPVSFAYTIFMSSTFAAYLIVLKKIAKENLFWVLVLICPAISIMIGAGQNGFLTGALVGLACLGLKSNRSWAGVPLGIMVIKPHLAIGIGLYAIVSRRWKVIFIAATTIILLSLVSTLLMGPSIWMAFIASVGEARNGLARGDYPFFRMVSIYAALFTFGVPVTIAALVQLVVACCAIVGVWFASRRFQLNVALGLAAISSAAISPYIYDYDLPVFGIGLALLMPDIKKVVTTFEQIVLYALCFFSSAWSLGVVTVDLIHGKLMSTPLSQSKLGEWQPLSLGGIAVVAALLLCWVFMVREKARSSEAAL
ncbi:glycosyltransferase family 87 protein [Methylovirgula sp. 4M-Z18]|uniref:glycosyltransferase family 87 protein n=1 Tax=Methylovirgula sp. 4M-Z18 TaxID=2293567 RepID=UPI000E2F12BB|nr:glycosyltransferase family 87 protein [Methylovirgula sp. 4M-Z18]RFB75486.1 DUF2029 domain-containing protein [Methylovirgula sp. 4M-Z18]